MEFVTLREAELFAKKKIKNKTFQWLQSGAEDNYTLDKNFLDLRKIKIKPKHLNKVGNLDLSRNFFGVLHENRGQKFESSRVRHLFFESAEGCSLQN